MDPKRQMEHYKLENYNMLQHKSGVFTFWITHGHEVGFIVLKFIVEKIE